MKTTKRKRRIFTPEFKRQAVALYETSGRRLAAAAAEIDVSETVLRHWIGRFGAALSPAASRGGSGAGLSLADQAAEIARLRREVTRLKAERDILKKAAALMAPAGRIRDWPSVLGAS